VQLDEIRQCKDCYLHSNIKNKDWFCQPCVSTAYLEAISLAELTISSTGFAFVCPCNISDVRKSSTKYQLSKTTKRILYHVLNGEMNGAED
jgi:hypothetical protein